jgi:hypothetical protein
MKRSLLLPLSLALNVVLACAGAWLCCRPGPVTMPDAAPGESAGETSENALLGTFRPAPAPGTPATVEARRAFDWSQLQSDDLQQYVTNLQAIACPKEAIREIITAMVNDEFVRQRHAAYAPYHARFWELVARSGQWDEDGKTELEERCRKLREERDERLAAALGTDQHPQANAREQWNDRYRATLNYLPQEKRQKLAELDGKFDTRRAEICQNMRAGSPEENAQLATLEQERDEARRQLLTSGELDEYTVRISGLGSWAQNLAGFEAAEGEYRALNQLRALATNQLGQAQFNEQSRALLGEERFAVFQRAQDPRWSEVLGLAERCRVPPATIERIYQARVIAEQQWAATCANPALAPAERQALAGALRSETRRELMAALGPVAGEAYLRHDGSWVGALK